MPGILQMITPAEAIRDGGNVRLPVIIRFQPSLSPAAVAKSGTVNTAEQALTISGVLTTDVVLAINKKAAQAKLGIVGFRAYSVASQIAVTFMVGSTSVTPTASQVYQVVILRGR